MTALPVPSSHSSVQEPLFRTATGTRAHLAPCPHVHGADVLLVTPDDQPDLPVCEWSQKELAGVGRRYFDFLDEAMRFFGSHVGTERTVRDALRFVQHDEIWVPNSGSYIALGREGLAVAWVGKTYVVPARGVLVTLPGYVPGGGGGVARDEVEPKICERCRLALPVTGICDDCD
ncbi:MAG TPA: hypothetical protein VFG72_06750 [Marmoricola sp.]|nr:hypothetical protein [Marmoricola sp.]